MRRLSFAILLAALLAPRALVAQETDQTLADIRQELSVLFLDIQRLRRELSTTGAPQGTGLPPGGGTLERVDAIEAELQRLTAKTEQLEFRVNSVVTDGTNRIGDLEFRLCELEPACDIGSLGDTPSLGGVDIAAPQGLAPAPESNGSQLAVVEQDDFDRARAALDAGNLEKAAEEFAAFNETYPGSPLAVDALMGRAEALDKLGATRDAASAYLDAFAAAPDGAQAPQALIRLGLSLEALGQRGEACLMLAEVETRFPQAGAVSDARAQMANLGCS